MNRSNRELKNIYATQKAIATGNQQALQKQIQRERIYNEVNRTIEKPCEEIMFYPRRDYIQYAKNKLNKFIKFCKKLNNIDFLTIKGYD